jgi:hypothetical protein
MALERFTLSNTVWSRLQTQLNKDANKPLKEELGRHKITEAPGNARIVWEPTMEFYTMLHRLLTIEETWTRNKSKGGSNHKLMLDTIAQLRRKIPADVAAAHIKEAGPAK